MPTWLIVVLAVLGGLIVVLAVGGAIANARRRRAREGAFRHDLEEVNRALAVAHAQDKGWERGSLEAAARRAFEERRPSDTVRELQLVQVIDRPGTDEDKAVFHVGTDGGEARLVLGRSGGHWVADQVD